VIGIWLEVSACRACTYNGEAGRSQGKADRSIRYVKDSQCVQFGFNILGYADHVRGSVPGPFLGTIAIQGVEKSALQLFELDIGGVVRPRKSVHRGADCDLCLEVCLVFVSGSKIEELRVGGVSGFLL
jgi:hypothetical protein